MQYFVDNGRNLEKLPTDTEEDPFYDPLAHKLIGKATMFLDGLSYLLEMEESVPIIDRRVSVICLRAL